MTKNISYDEKDPRQYNSHWYGIDFRVEPHRYKIGRGEQGVLIAQPYKGEILPHWRFKTPEIARESAKTIYNMFLRYLANNEFPGADIARKFLQMGVTRSRRYANHASGKKYAEDGSVLPLEEDRWTSEKAKSAEEFNHFYRLAIDNPVYRDIKRTWQK